MYHSIYTSELMLTRLRLYEKTCDILDDSDDFQAGDIVIYHPEDGQTWKRENRKIAHVQRMPFDKVLLSFVDPRLSILQEQLKDHRAKIEKLERSNRGLRSYAKRLKRQA